MSYAAHRRKFGSYADQVPSKTATAPKRRGIFRRILDAMREARQREADRHIARFLAARSAGSLTDDLEREISQRLLTSNWSVNASPYSERRFS
jgi:hypothetical protein